MSSLVETDPIHLVEEDNITPPPHYDENGPPRRTPPAKVRAGRRFYGC